MFDWNVSFPACCLNALKNKVRNPTLSVSYTQKSTHRPSALVIVSLSVWNHCLPPAPLHTSSKPCDCKQPMIEKWTVSFIRVLREETPVQTWSRLCPVKIKIFPPLMNGLNSWWRMKRVTCYIFITLQSQSYRCVSVLVWFMGTQMCINRV